MLCPQAWFDDRNNTPHGRIDYRTGSGRALSVDWLVCPASEHLETHIADPAGFLSPPERATSASLAFPKRRREWMLGRWTAKRLLCLGHERYRSLALETITVGNDPDGAPYLSVDGEGRLPLSLSISHREERAFCALASSPPDSGIAVGADIEWIEPRAPAFVHDFFTAEEAKRAWACPPQVRDTFITVLWSGKEAVLKALREGLRVDTRRVEITCVGGLEPSPAACLPVRETWYPLCIHSTLPGGDTLVAWWRPDGHHVLTCALRYPA